MQEAKERPGIQWWLWETPWALLGSAEEHKQKGGVGGGEHKWEQKDQAVAPVANVTQSKLAQLTAQSADKPAIREEGELMSQRTILPKSEIRLLLDWKGRRCGWSLQTSWCQNPLFLWLASSRRSGHDVPVKFQQGKRYSLFYDFLFLYV